MECTFPSVHHPIEPPGISTEKGTFPLCCRPWLTTMDYFTDLCVGWSGWAHDAWILRNSHPYERLQTGTFFPQRTFAIGDVEMPVCIVADAAYPLMPWLMKPYIGHLTPSREVFNAYLTHACLQVECAFGRLMGRFRCPLIRLDMGEHNIPEVVAACCILHNLVESKGEAFLSGWEPMAEVEGRQCAQPQTAAVHQTHQVGVCIREALREHFSAGAQ
uniref:DDE Tnp4 domain-containing protein n=1 Tax=Pelodiscus sinensis TaxID=13735 RepID=K7EXC2_PELSI